MSKRKREKIMDAIKTSDDRFEEPQLADIFLYDADMVRVDLGPSVGEHNIPTPVYKYLDDLYQENSALHTRIVSRGQPLGQSNLQRPRVVGWCYGGARAKSGKKGRTRIRIEEGNKRNRKHVDNES